MELRREERLFGVALFTKEEPLSVAYGMGIEEHDHEGRILTAEYEDYYIVTCYTPNSQSELARLPYRMKWEDAFLGFLKDLEKKTSDLCGDLNVAHKEIDLKNPKTNRNNAGFTDQEREKFSALMDAGFIDTYRCFYPETTGYILGGLTVLRPERKTQGGGLIIFVCPNV